MVNWCVTKKRSLFKGEKYVYPDSVVSDKQAFSDPLPYIAVTVVN